MNETIAVDSILGPVTLLGVAGSSPWRASLASVRPADGLEEIVLSLETATGEALPPPRVALQLHAPVRGAVACWTPQHVHFEMPLPWTQARVGANAARDLPLYANVGADGAARLVLAVSECVRRVAIRGVVDEYRADEELEVAFFTEPEEPLSRYSARIRLDTRVRDFAAALSDAARWLDSSVTRHSSLVARTRRRPRRRRVRGTRPGIPTTSTSRRRRSSRRRAPRGSSACAGYCSTRAG